MIFYATSQTKNKSVSMPVSVPVPQGPQAPQTTQQELPRDAIDILKNFQPPALH
jgi:hypothetical protein